MHDERLHLMYVFAHLGDFGERYLHQVMKWTYNYRYSITKGFIDKCFDRPIGCNRLRECYSDHAFLAHCRCDFPMVEGTYPSPVLHAHAVGAADGVTLPRSPGAKGTLTEETPEEFNTYRRICETAQRMMILNSERRLLEEEIKSCKQTLASLFNMLRIESVDIGIGTLARERDSDGGYKWSLDIE